MLDSTATRRINSCKNNLILLQSIGKCIEKSESIDENLCNFLLAYRRNLVCRKLKDKLDTSDQSSRSIIGSGLISNHSHLPCIQKVSVETKNVEKTKLKSDKKRNKFDNELPDITKQLPSQDYSEIIRKLGSINSEETLRAPENTLISLCESQSNESISTSNSNKLEDQYLPPLQTSQDTEDSREKKKQYKILHQKISRICKNRTADIYKPEDSINLEEEEEDLLYTPSSQSRCDIESVEASPSTITYEDFQESGAKFGYKYKGNYDLDGFRLGPGCLEWIEFSSERKYCGNFHYNNLHGDGFYFIKKEKCFNFYKGGFYNNEIHGYGLLVFDNGNEFEGLFKENSRFGPGVLTYSNGTQDVGLWYSDLLIRLCIDLSNFIPILGRTSNGKRKLMEYKKIIQINCTNEDKALQVLRNLNADDETLNRYKELYNPYVRNKNSTFFDKFSYDSTFLGPEDGFIDVLKNYNVVKLAPDSTIINEENYHSIVERNNLWRQIREIEKEIVLLKEWWKKHQKKGKTCCHDCNCTNTKMHLVNKEVSFLNSVLDFLYYKLCIDNEKSCSESVPEIQKIAVDSLLAWNNEELFVEIIKHGFRCRKSEENVRFNVKNVMLGVRNSFAKAGVHEESCRTFLEKCSLPNELNALNLLITQQKINLDVCDSRGNTGLHIATWCGNQEVIKILANNGANLNASNDEGLTPLNLAILLYLEVIHKVNDWEVSFLPKPRNRKVRFGEEWKSHESCLKLLKLQNPGISDVIDHSSINLKRLKSSRLRRLSSGISRDSMENQQFSFDNIFSKRGTSSLIPASENSYESNQKMDQIIEIIEMLLHYGADTNFDSVPYPPFFMSLFTKSTRIVQGFLKCKADPNIVIQGMTPLHIIACMEPCDESYQIMVLLLEYFADPNKLSDPCIGSEYDAYLVGDTEFECETRGKNALQLICLREYFTKIQCKVACQMVEKLFEAKIRKEEHYLGQSYLSMAILKGNVTLVECLLKFCDPSATLGNSLGNSLTILGLQRYNHVLPFEKCKEIIDLILEIGVSPFDALYSHYNILEFLDTDSPPSIDESKKSWQKYVEYIENYTAIINGKGQDKDCNKLTKIYIQDKSRHILDIIVRFKAVFYLYSFIICGVDLNLHTESFAKLIGTSNEALSYLEFLFSSGRMPQSSFCHRKILQLLIYVDGVTKNVRIKHESGNKPQFENFTDDDYKNLIKDSNFGLSEKPKPEFIANVITDANLLRCDVCYFCMHKTNKILLKCPLCGIIRFCSEACNYLSTKLRRLHHCSEFYRNIYDKYKTLIEKNEILPLYGLDSFFCRYRNENEESRKTGMKPAIASQRKVCLRMRGGTNGICLGRNKEKPRILLGLPVDSREIDIIEEEIQSKSEQLTKMTKNNRVECNPEHKFRLKSFQHNNKFQHYSEPFVRCNKDRIYHGDMSCTLFHETFGVLP